MRPRPGSSATDTITAVEVVGPVTVHISLRTNRVFFSFFSVCLFSCGIVLFLTGYRLRVVSHDGDRGSEAKGGSLIFGLSIVPKASHSKHDDQDNATRMTILEASK